MSTRIPTRCVIRVALYGGLVLAASTAFTKHAHAADTFKAKVTRAVSGDTFEIETPDGKKLVRLVAADAPEEGQPHFGPARDSLHRTLRYRQVEITPVGEPSGNMIFARVELGDDIINLDVIRKGWAWYDDRDINSSALADAMSAARRQKRGIWQDRRPQKPWEYAARGRAPEGPSKQEQLAAATQSANSFLNAAVAGDAEKVRAAVSRKAAAFLKDAEFAAAAETSFTLGEGRLIGRTAHIPLQLKRAGGEPAAPGTGGGLAGGGLAGARPGGGLARAATGDAPSNLSGDVRLRREGEAWRVYAISVSPNEEHDPVTFDMEFGDRVLAAAADLSDVINGRADEGDDNQSDSGSYANRRRRGRNSRANSANDNNQDAAQQAALRWYSTSAAGSLPLASLFMTFADVAGHDGTGSDATSAIAARAQDQTPDTQDRQPARAAADTPQNPPRRRGGLAAAGAAAVEQAQAAEEKRKQEEAAKEEAESEEDAP